MCFGSPIYYNLDFIVLIMVIISIHHEDVVKVTAEI